MAERDFILELKKQIGFMKNSCGLYDAGHKEEAIRIGTALRVVFHKTQVSHPIIEKVPISALLSVGSTQIPPGNKFVSNLTNVILKPQDGIAEFVPREDEKGRSGQTSPLRKYLPVKIWWEKEIVYRLEGEQCYFRKDIVLAAANKDGGAHVEDVLPPEYLMLVDGAGWKMRWNIGGVSNEITFKNAHLAALRQMAFEVLNSPQIERIFDSK